MAAQLSWSLCDHLDISVYPLDSDELRAKPLPESYERPIPVTLLPWPPILDPSVGGMEQGSISDLLSGGPQTEGSTTEVAGAGVHCVLVVAV